MDKQKVDAFIAKNGGKLPSDAVAPITAKLLAAPDSKWDEISAISFKKPGTALLLALFLGNLGADRFYVGQVGLGVIKLLTCGGSGIWTIIDWFLARKTARKVNLDKLQLYI